MLTLVFESYRLTQADVAKLLEPDSDDGRIYQQVRTLENEGQAELEHVAAVTTRSGNRTKIESIHELIYPTEFSPPAKASLPSFPTGFETRNLGETFEVESTILADGISCHLDAAPRFTTFQRWDEYGLNAAGPTTAQPLFLTRMLNSSRAIYLGKPALLGNFDAAAEAPAADPQQNTHPATPRSRSLLFVTLHIPKIISAQKPASAASTNNIALSYSFHSIRRDQARDLLTSNPGDLSETVRNLNASGEIALEAVKTMHSRSGQRVRMDAFEEVIYPVNFEPSASEGNPPGAHSPTAFDTRNKGWSIEFEPTASADLSFCDMSFSLEYTTLFDSIGAGKGPGVVSSLPYRPIFQSQKINASVTVGLGQTLFLGTMSPPRDTGLPGAKDEGRVWLAFARYDAPVTQ